MYNIPVKTESACSKTDKKEIPMKKILALALALLMLFSLTACASSKSAAPTDRLDQIKKAGVLQVATEPYFAPYEFMDPSKEGQEAIMGADVKIMEAIAKEIGVKLEIIPLDFTAVLTGITTAKYDMAISAIAYSLERSENMNLSNVYKASDTGYGFIIRAEDAGKYNSIEDLKDAVVATQSGSVQEGIYRTDVTDKGCKELKLFAQMTDAYLAVQENRADVCICSTDSASLYAEANGGVLMVPDFRFTIDPNMNGTVIACPKENTDELIKVVNKVVEELKANGSIDAWFEEAQQQAKELGVE